MDLFLFTLQNDWAVLLPIVACSIALVAVSINRFMEYAKNKRDTYKFVQRLQQELRRGSLEYASGLSQQVGGLVGEVADEGLGLLAQNVPNFERSFDITLALAVHKLEKHLPVLGTIGTIAPYLGLFGTVVRILLTFGELSTSNGNTSAPAVMFGIGSALIATAAGLIVAILAVTLNNYFRNKVAEFEDNFQLVKLVLMGYNPSEAAAYAREAAQQQAAGRVPVSQAPAGFGSSFGSQAQGNPGVY
jgi:biopolymer transport protein ExbB